MEMNEKIKTLRHQRGLTLEQVGDYVGVGKSTVRKWENGMIENMRRDKIAKLAAILGTTPDYLMGWNSNQDEWTTAFCKSLAQELAVIDKTDLHDSGADVHRMESVSNGNVPISLSEACNIANELGASLDAMVGLTKYDSKTIEFIELIAKLSVEQRKMIVAQIKGLLVE